MIGQVFLGRPAEPGALTPPVDPIGEGQGIGRVPAAVTTGQHHQRRVQDPARPFTRRIPGRLRRPGADLFRFHHGQPARGRVPGVVSGVDAGIGEGGQQRRAERVDGGPAVGQVAGLAGVHTDLKAGGTAHHGRAPSTHGGEAAFHRGVARCAQFAGGGPIPVYPGITQVQASRGEKVFEVGQIGRDDGVQVAQRGLWLRGDLHLTSGLEAQRRACRKREGGAVGAQRPRGVRAERGGEIVGVERPGGLVGVVHGEFQLYAEKSRWPVLEAHGSHIRLALGAVRKDLRRRVRRAPGLLGEIMNSSHLSAVQSVVR